MGFATRYWNDEEHTKQVMSVDDGKVWMHTGDEGIMDEEGYLRSECSLLFILFSLLIMLVNSHW
jgi:acyl-CoA synthetase (AMP-forming)/AMP-acid ligase II